MPYCIKCGVELSDSEEKCPLCGTKVYHPDIIISPGKKSYPANNDHEETMKSSGILFILTFILFSITAMTLVINISINGTVTWGGYPAGALIIIYFAAVFPIWFKRPNPVILSAVDFTAVALYLMYVNYITGGGWFLTFALPVVGGVALITVGAITLIWYVKRGFLYIFSGIFISSGLFAVLLECLINYTFKSHFSIVWSVYPLTGSVLIGIGLIIVALCRPLRESLHRKFFV